MGFNSSVLFSLSIAVISIYLWSRSKKKRKREKSCDILYPPFPEIITRILRSSNLCFLSTSDLSGNPHSSLMSFTYFADTDKNNEEIIILTTRENTKKFELIQACPSVSLLIHDFPHLKGQESQCEKTASITLNGIANIETGSIQEKYRQIHAERNPDYKQFILGESIRVISIRVESARICDFQDQVTHWDVYSSTRK